MPQLLPAGLLLLWGLFLGVKLFHKYISMCSLYYNNIQYAHTFYRKSQDCVPNFRNFKVFCAPKILNKVWTHTTWQNSTEFCYLTLSHLVSKQCVLSSMTTLSGLPRAARVAAWQCSTLYTVMSPSIHSFVSELCQERQGSWQKETERDNVKKEPRVLR